MVILQVDKVADQKRLESAVIQNNIFYAIPFCDFEPSKRMSNYCE